MKTQKLFPFVTLIAIFISACGNTPLTDIPAEDVLSSVNTAVALTSSASAAQAASLIKTTVATMTPIPTATATLIKSLSTPTTYTSYAASGSVCDGSAYISDVTISDGTVISPSETFTKTWRVQNTGTCTWNSNYSIMFSSGDEMSGETTTIDQSVAPNGTGDISVELTAPDSDGTYTGYWIMSNSSGIAFGNYVYVQIVVSSDSSTSTPTSTATTIESTATTEPTSTSAPTSTTAPTAVPTEELPATLES